MFGIFCNNICIRVFADISDAMDAAMALKQANPTLTYKVRSIRKGEF